MGLDSVELVIAFEEAFGIPIGDSIAEKMRTPRDVIDFVETHRKTGTKKLCLTRRAFHRVRDRLTAVGIARSAIRPDATLEQLFPPSTRLELWHEARGEISRSQWLDLVRPVRLQKAIIIAPVLIACAVLVTQFIRAPDSNVSFVMLLAGGTAILSAYLLLQITQTQRRHFPGFVTVRDLATSVATGGPASLLKEGEGLTREQIALTVRTIVIEQLGIPDSRYGEGKDFVHDLGMD